MNAAGPTPHPAWLWCLALAAFAIGTEAFMLTGLLPPIAQDLATSATAVGYLATAYSATYAVSAPILAAASAHLPPRRILLVAAIGFALANLAAAASTTYPMLLVARLLAGLFAALFMPAAFAYTGANVDPAVRGRSLAVVAAGMSCAVALGAPLATLIAGERNWRLPFAVVAGAVVLVAGGLAMTVRASRPGARMLLRTRLQPARDPRVLSALCVAALWTMGSFSAFIFLSLLLDAVAGIGGRELALALFVSGASGVIGSAIGGRIVDAVGPERMQGTGLLLLAGVLASFPLLGLWSPRAANFAPAMLAVGLWGGVSWALNTAQQVRLLKLSPQAPTFALSLNSSALYLGIACGSGLGGAVLALASPLALGWVAASCELLAFAALRVSLRIERSADPSLLKPAG